MSHGPPLSTISTNSAQFSGDPHCLFSGVWEWCIESEELTLPTSVFPSKDRNLTKGREQTAMEGFGSQALKFIALLPRQVNDKSQGRTLLIGFKMKFSPSYSTLGSWCLNPYALFGLWVCSIGINWGLGGNPKPRLQWDLLIQHGCIQNLPHLHHIKCEPPWFDLCCC